jgi:hypothetical protein
MDIEVPTYMDAKLAIVGHTNKHTPHTTHHTTQPAHTKHTTVPATSGYWLLFIMGVVRGDGDSWPE